MNDESYLTESKAEDHDLRTYSMSIFHYSKTWPGGERNQIVYNKALRDEHGNIVSSDRIEEALDKAIKLAEKGTQPPVLTRFDEEGNLINSCSKKEIRDQSELGVS